MDIKLSFLGAAKNVTGSKYLLCANGAKILIDCGMYQEHDLKERNWEPCPVPPRELDAVLLTHAHLDHCGLLPRLVKEGFKGKINATVATIDLARIVIADCAKINEEDAQFKRKRHQRENRKGPHPVLPLYTVEDAKDVLPHFASRQFNKPFSLAEGIEAEFCEVGHILGASFIRITVTQGDEKRVIVFSGDVGRWSMPIIRDPAQIGAVDYIICESTYGDREHGLSKDIPGELADIVNGAVRSRGNIVIPSFAIERTQDLLYYLAQLIKANTIPRLRIFVDSPMAVRVTDVFRKHPQLFDQETTALMRSYRMPGLTLVRSIADSKSINHVRSSVIIIAGAGMCTGGRIKHHLVRNLPRPECTILFVGYQASETLGRIILDGAKTVRILGQEFPVRAQIRRISGFSAHADSRELVRWLKTATTTPRHIFVTHGEPKAAEAFMQSVGDALGWEASTPEYKDTATLA